ncbi:MAG: M43 family zinc metalloprotease [Flavobacteriales bacterium]
MSIKSILFSTASLLFMVVFAQETPFCTTHSLSKAQLEAHPDQKQQVEELENAYQVFSTQHSMAKQSMVSKTIPVVVHVIHDYSSNFIPDAQIYNVIDIVNEDYSMTNSDLSEVVTAFQSIIGDMDIEFRLAQKDPDGNCTQGITRTYSELTNNAGENVKSLVKWDPSMYLNIWVVEEIASGAGGYSYLPGSAPFNDNNAGIVVLHQQFGTIGTSNGGQFAAHTLSHEIGHYLGLNHTWGSTNSPEEPDNCFDDDNVDDTPNCIGQSFNCDLTIQTCGSLDNVQNIMCYAGCPNMFTEGQATRVGFFMNNHTTGNAPRFNLWQQANLIATGTNNGFNQVVCEPILDFYTKKTLACPGESITIKSYSYNADSLTNTWSTPGASSASPNADGSITVNYDQAGEYEIGLTVNTLDGSQYSTNETNYITIINTENALEPGVYEDFESPLLVDQPTQEHSWLRYYDNQAWELATNTGFNSSKSYRIRTSDFEEGEVSILQLPAIDLSSSTSGTKLHFKYAYKKRFPFTEDKLKIYVSKNCGKTWIPREILDTDELATVSGTQSTAFTPSSDADWQQASVNLASVNGKPEVFIKFEMEGEFGNYLYIDDIEVHNFALSTEELEANPQKLNVYPNPTTEHSVIEFSSQATMTYSIHIVNTLGQTVYQRSAVADENQTQIRVPKNLNSGLYLVKLYHNSTLSMSKFQVLN